MKHTTPVPETMKLHFANWLKTTRKSKKVSLKMLAEAAGISTSSVAHHCEGINFPHDTHPHILPAYEKVLGETWVYPAVAPAAHTTSPAQKPAEVSDEKSPLPISIANAKLGLAAFYGVLPDAVEIVIRG